MRYSTRKLELVTNILFVIVGTLNSKRFTDRAPNYGEGSLAPPKCIAAIYTGVPRRTPSATPTIPQEGNTPGDNLIGKYLIRGIRNRKMTKKNSRFTQRIKVT